MTEIDQRIEAILADCGRLLRAGEPVSIPDLVACNPDLPTLARLLLQLPGLPTTGYVPAPSGAVLSVGLPATSPSTAFPPREPAAGAILDGVPAIRLVKRIGRGGSGEVWAATDVATGNPRAVKRLRPDRFSDAAIHALREEARLMDGLPQHPGRVKIYGLHNTADGPALVLGYVGSGPVAALAPLPWADAVRYIDQTAEALEDVHALGIKHGDITPNNLLLDRSAGHDRVVLTDFGLASHSTVGGGTPGYAPPELRAGLTGRAGDIHGLAGTLFYLLSRSPPFPPSPGESFDANLERAGRGLPARLPELAGVPEGVVAAIRRGLEPDPARRPTLAGFRVLLAQARLAGFHWDEAARAGLAACPARLTVTFTRSRPGRDLSHVRATAGAGALPPPPPTLPLATGDTLLLEARADRPGYLAVLDLEAGRESVFFPGPGEDGRIDPARPIAVRLDMTPTPGELVAVVWADRLGPPDAAGWARRLLFAGVVPAGRNGGSRAGTPLPAPAHWTAVAAVIGPPAPPPERP